MEFEPDMYGSSEDGFNRFWEKKNESQIMGPWKLKMSVKSVLCNEEYSG